jgi:hypothetical protein
MLKLLISKQLINKSVVNSLKLASTYSSIRFYNIDNNISSCNVNSSNNAIGLKKSFSTNSKRDKRLKQQQKYIAKFNIDQNGDNINQLPDFHSLLRQLYRRAHPDLLRHTCPESADINDASMQILNGILSNIKTFNEFPQAIIKTIPFHLKNSNGELECKYLSIRTAGGHCKRQLTNTFEIFFKETGILGNEGVENGKFQWGKEYFPLTPTTNDEEK